VTTLFEAEIREQPAALGRLLDAGREAAEAAAEKIRGRTVRFAVLAARGSSDNAARYGQYVLGIRNRLVAALATPSLFTQYQAAPSLAEALVIGISQSGQSPDIVAVVREGRRQGAVTLAITNAPDSPLASAADTVLPLFVGAERAVAATKTYTAQVAALAMLSAALDPSAEAWDELRSLPDLVARAIEQNARAVRLADGGGGFAFFDPEALDVTIKALDGRPLAPALWVFAGSLTSVQWELVVSVPGEGTTHSFRSRRPGCGGIDASTFLAPVEAAAAEPSISRAAASPVGPTEAPTPASAPRLVRPTAAPVTGACTPTPTTLCLLGDRFRAEATWRNPRDGTGGTARALPLRDRSGFFSFFDRGNPEVAVKLLDGRAVNGAFWLFDGRLTDLEYELVVTDTATGARRVYTRPAGSLCAGADLEAFAARGPTL